jgi:hypothetical protein
MRLITITGPLSLFCWLGLNGHAPYWLAVAACIVWPVLVIGRYVLAD